MRLHPGTINSACEAKWIELALQQWCKRLPLIVLLVCNWLRFSCQAEVSGPDTSWVKDERVKILFPILGRSPDFISTQVVRYHKYVQPNKTSLWSPTHVNLPLSKAYAMLSLKATYSPKLGKVVRTRSKQFHGVSLCLVMGSCLQRGICLIERHLLLLPVWTPLTVDVIHHLIGWEAGNGRRSIRK